MMTRDSAQALDLIAGAREKGYSSIALGSALSRVAGDVPAFFATRNANSGRVLAVGSPSFVRDLVAKLKSINPLIETGNLGDGTPIVVTTHDRALRAAETNPEKLAGFDVAYMHVKKRPEQSESAPRGNKFSALRAMAEPEGRRDASEQRAKAELALIAALKGTTLVQSADFTGDAPADKHFLVPPEVILSMQADNSWVALETFAAPEISPR